MKPITLRYTLLMALFLALPAQAAITINVEPSGGDDTASIQNAFERAIEFGPDVTVKFAEGTFHVSRSIVVYGFQGKWRGAGKNKTVIEVKGDPDRECHDPFATLPPGTRGCFPLERYLHDPDNPDAGDFLVISAFIFIGTGERPAQLDVARLKLVFRGVTDPFFPGHYSRGLMPPNVLPTTLLAVGLAVMGHEYWKYGPEIHTGKLILDNVTIKGELGTEVLISGTPAAYNLNKATAVWGGGEIFGNFENNREMRTLRYMKAEIRITRSTFANAFQAIGADWLKDATVVIGGSAESGNNFFTELGMTIFDPSNSLFKISHNRGIVGSVVAIESAGQQFIGFAEGPQPQVPFPELSQLVINENDFRLHATAPGQSVGGINIADIYYGVARQQRLAVVIDNNRFRSQKDSGLIPTAIDIFMGSGVIATRNTISGSYSNGGIIAGYCTDSPNCNGSFPADDLLLVGNEIKVSGGGDLFQAPIWLGSDTSRATVVSDALVQDDGTDNTVITP